MLKSTCFILGSSKIETVQPFGVDVCSGVRSNGKLDIQKLSAFINAVRSL
ncbi:MAG: hypothetical protein IPJ02_01360 [Chitinophagaceae bacterium]|nr:hypothetical protein [Chitinophagaceae bacterium]